MCNVEDEGETHPPKNENNQSLRGRKCVKCDQPGVLVTRIHDSFCKSCFQVYVIHKFRAAVGKSKLIREGEQVLLALSGGANSSALLHLVQDGLSERAHRKLRFIPTLLHVDECGVLDMSSDMRQELRKSVVQLMLSSGFPSYITNLEQALKIERRTENTDVSACVPQDEEQACLFQHVDDGYDGSLPPTSSSEHHLELKTLINSLASATSQEDFIRNLRNQLIVSVARQLGFNKVLTAECSTRLSIRILTDVAQGRGSQLSQNTAFCDQRNCDVLFVRPVRDLSAKELTMYNNLFGVKSVFIPNITTKTDRDSSIERLTETFVTGLQADFSSTVANIVRTSEKLESPDLGDSQSCAFCQSPLDTNVGKASALFAIEFSQKISQIARQQTSTGCGLGPNSGDSNGGSSCPDTYHGQDRTNTPESCSEVDKDLCYGCRLTLQNFNYDTSHLPSFITKKPVELKPSDNESLREKIAEFLIEDADS